MKKIIYIAALVIGFSYSLAASAASIIETMPTDQSIAVPAFSKNLTLGSSGADVVTLQDFLVKHGFLTIPPGVQKGYFGGLTKASLIAYQKKNNITPAAGYFGPITKAQVQKDIIANSSSSQGPITILSPIGGEKWTVGSSETISFSAPHPLYTADNNSLHTALPLTRVENFDINLISDVPTCPASNGMCPFQNNGHIRYPIVSNYYDFSYGTTSSTMNVRSFVWKVGDFATSTPVNFSGDNSQYNSIEVCISGTPICSRGEFFTITQ